MTDNESRNYTGTTKLGYTPAPKQNNRQETKSVQ